MKTLLGTTAIAATLLFAAPALAQQDYYNTNPTPQEKAQTHRLNDQAVRDARGTADNGDHSDADMAAPVAPTRDAADYAAKKAEYDRQMAIYNDRRAAYDRDRARYRADRGDYAQRWEAFYGYRDFRPVALQPDSRLIGLRVNVRGGGNIGRIRDVDRDGAGRVSRVQVSVSHNRSAWIDADDLRFDAAHRVVYTSLSRGQIQDMSRLRFPRY